MKPISVKEASQVTGWSVNYIRSACKRGVIGDGYSNGKGKRYACIVSPGRLAAFMGISGEELAHEVRMVRQQNFRDLHRSDKP